jgi:hypothetical protein
VGRIVVFRYSRARWAILFFLVIASLPMTVSAQAGSTGRPSETVLTRGMVARTEQVERLEVPRKGKPNLIVQAERSSWISITRAREITVPPQGFYIVTLANGTVATLINKEEKQRHAGDMWAVPDGQSMSLRILDKRQENVMLHVLSIRITH